MNSEEKIKIEFNKKIQSEVEEFRKRMTNESPEYVYSACEKVCFIETLYDMLFCTNIASDAKENISFDAIKWLNKQKNPLEFLYGKWLSCGGNFSESWEDMSNWVKQLFNEEKAENI